LTPDLVYMTDTMMNLDLLYMTDMMMTLDPWPIIHDWNDDDLWPLTYCTWLIWWWPLTPDLLYMTDMMMTLDPWPSVHDWYDEEMTLDPWPVFPAPVSGRSDTRPTVRTPPLGLSHSCRDFYQGSHRTGPGSSPCGQRYYRPQAANIPFFCWPLSATDSDPADLTLAFVLCKWGPSVYVAAKKNNELGFFFFQLII
jgi:hypothetical protein